MMLPKIAAADADAAVSSTQCSNSLKDAAGAGAQSGPSTSSKQLIWLDELGHRRVGTKFEWF
jgi:hypothetical protein